jgi:CubicO group peptidase (beta-lactamase class C family)
LPVELATAIHGRCEDAFAGVRAAFDRNFDHGWGLGYLLNQRGIAGPNPRAFGHGGSGGSFAFVDLEHGIGYAYVMNRFDATQCNADPRTVALSDEVYAALGVAPR